MLQFALLLAVTDAGAEGDLLLRPVERALERVSFGPQVGASAIGTTSGLGAQITLGFGATIFDRYVRTDPACEARRAREREQLGGAKIKVWADVLEKAQQECRAIEESYFPKYDFGLELGHAFATTPTNQVRAWLSPIGWRQFMVGVSASGVLAEEAGGGGSIIGARIGPELSAHLRLTPTEKWRPTATVFLRGELTALRRDVFDDQVLLGARFMFDLGAAARPERQRRKDGGQVRLERLSADDTS